MHPHKIGIIPGDGIGRDVIKASMIVLEAINDLAGHRPLTFKPMVTGEKAFERTGSAFPKETYDGIAECDAVLFGAAGNPHTVEVLNGFRNGFELYANVRPIKAFPNSNAIQPKADFVVVRENLEGLYRGLGWIDGDYHVNLRVFTRCGMERILRYCFELARRENRPKVTFTHKAHVLTYTDQPMRELFYAMAKDYPDIEAEDMTIDACAMQVVRRPEQFQVIFAENANGDILSDVGAGVIGGMGFAFGGNVGDAKGVFEPIHGTAPKYADKNVVNPIAALLAAKMMMDYLGERDIAQKMEDAISSVLAEGRVRTYDLGGSSSTTDVAEAIADYIRSHW
ncbi:MAG: isocitrate/isopropylmalate family dehydrogenase [Rhodospirillales bacterium]|nr:isocitrate/isopropylmalate family dehydrogenase [Rhodospirillales bacterium]